MKKFPISTLVFAALTILPFSAATSLAQSTEQPLTPSTFINISKEVLPSVVSINVRILPSKDLLERHGVETLEELREKMFDNRNSPLLEEFFRDFRSGDLGTSGSGSGVVIHVDGKDAYAITNNHVISDSERVEYTIVLDRSLAEDPIEISGDDVKIIGSDELTDLAVVKFPLPENITLKPVDFANSDEVMVGEWVLALGNPLDLNNSVSQGIVSAKNRDISRQTRIEQLLQTTAVINPGNSGGPLVNLEGKIVGINNAIATTTGRWEGVGFAIPSNQAKRVSEMLIKDGKVSRGYLGIVMDDRPDDSGIEIINIQEGMPAEKIGLKAGDVVLRVNGEKVHTTRELLTAIGNQLAGEVVELEVIPKGKTQKDIRVLNVELTERPSEEVLTARAQNSTPRWSERSQPTPEKKIEDMGIEVEPDSDSEYSGLRITKIEMDSPFRNRDFKKGDLLVQINGIDTKTPEDFLEAIENIGKTNSHIVLFRRDEETKFTSITQ